MIKNFCDQKKSSIGSDTSTLTLDEEVDTAEDNGLAPDEEDWTRILEGTRSIHYQRDKEVIVQGQAHKQRLYQIAKGSCRIEKQTDDGKTLVFGIISSKNDSIFGEISFLEGTGATASVVANESDTVIHVIEGYYLDILFDYFPGLSGRFYHYLATVLSTRLKQREAAGQGKGKDDEESEEDDKSLSKNPVSRTQNSESKKKKKRKSSKRMVVAAEEEWSAVVDPKKKPKITESTDRKDLKDSEEKVKKEKKIEDKKE